MTPPSWFYDQATSALSNDGSWRIVVRDEARSATIEITAGEKRAEEIAARLLLLLNEAAWRPFDTAPRDGSYFLACLAGDIVCEARWDAETGELYAANTDPHGYHDRPLEDARYWQPLPPAPEGATR